MNNKPIQIRCQTNLDNNSICISINNQNYKDIICTPWELSSQINNIENIFIENTLEFLSNLEADRSLRDWLKVLSSSGKIEIITPDMDYYCKLWLESTWLEETLKNPDSKAQQSFKTLWGDQLNSDPWDKNYTTLDTTVHKSGYNLNRLTFLLNRIGYLPYESKIIDNNICINAKKSLDAGGERQGATKLEDIRLDHRKRYEFAKNFINKENCIVTDGACGVAYGSYILASNQNVQKVQAIDISKEAIEHGKKYFNNNKIEYFLSNLEDKDIPTLSPDYFISFETIEHLPNPEKYIKKISENIKDNGIFIGSTPNETIMPYSPHFSYHTRHFTQDELKEMLTKYGFNNIKFYQQKREEPSDILNINDGQYIIFVAKKD